MITGSDNTPAYLTEDDVRGIIDPIPRKPWYFTRRHYQCLSCHELFTNEDAKRVREPHGEYTLRCCHCGSGEIDDAPKKVREKPKGIDIGLGRRKQRRDK